MREFAGITILCFLLLACRPDHLLVASPSTSCHPDQRHALLRFKHSFSITGPKVASWREDEDCCSWEGVTCDNSTGDVVGLDLASAGLRGSIDSSSPLFSLSHLRCLSLRGNDLLGSKVPPEIGVLTQLTCLDLSSLNISGILPTEISLLSKMVSLDLSDNSRLEMQDRTMRLLVRNLTQMEELNLGSVSMSTVDPTSLMNFSSSLSSLNLSSCLLGGNFPEFIFGLPNLHVLDLSWNNYLTGTLPESKWSPGLDYLSLGDCDFMGAVPNSIGNLSRLTHLDLSYNNFTGEFDLGILSTLEDLQFIDLFGLSISGEDSNHGFSLLKLQELRMGSCNLSMFPSFLSLSKELRVLYLWENKIKEIPDWLWSIGLDTLEELILDFNIIRGSIPPSICRQTFLSYVTLAGNNLVGVIPQCLGNLTNLRGLDLSNNFLSGQLPPSLANCTSLEVIRVGNNSIDGAPPTWLSMASITHINLQDNNFEGHWPPDVFLRSANLNYIYLSDNKFEGPLPLPSYSTKSYDASNNNFSGNMSSLICNDTSLMFLDLSENCLTGALPGCLGNITANLFSLNLRENEFGGRIPQICQEGSLLASLDLSKNRFEGPLPRSLLNCKQLEALDVGNNNMVDSFPDWLGQLPLKILSLRSNNFHDHVIISEGTHNFSQLCIMDLSNNNFEGNISEEFISGLLGMTRDDIDDFASQYMGIRGLSLYYTALINLKGVEEDMGKINVRFAMLDLSSNNFHGEIPRSIGLLKSLISLNFSHNYFSGKIPPSVGNLTYLESLDLSSNHLMGEIPNELVKLSFLGYLDLSKNNLTGPIPLGGHFNTFPNGSFRGNFGLCGSPLTRSCSPANREAEPPPEGKDDGEEGGGWLQWKYVALGFGTGMGTGISLGYMVLEIGRPIWLSRMVISFIN